MSLILEQWYDSETNSVKLALLLLTASQPSSCEFYGADSLELKSQNPAHDP